MRCARFTIIALFAIIGLIAPQIVVSDNASHEARITLQLVEPIKVDVESIDFGTVSATRQSNEQTSAEATVTGQEDEQYVVSTFDLDDGAVDLEHMEDGSVVTVTIDGIPDEERTIDDSGEDRFTMTGEIDADLSDKSLGTYDGNFTLVMEYAN